MAAQVSFDDQEVKSSFSIIIHSKAIRDRKTQPGVRLQQDQALSWSLGYSISILICCTID
jgi:hypothetical protein